MAGDFESTSTSSVRGLCHRPSFAYLACLSEKIKSAWADRRALISCLPAQSGRFGSFSSRKKNKELRASARLPLSHLHRTESERVSPSTCVVCSTRSSSEKLRPEEHMFFLRQGASFVPSYADGMTISW